MIVCCAGMQSSLRFALALLLVACDGPSLPADAGADAGPGLGCGPTLSFHPLLWSAPSIGLVPGATREVYVEFERDCVPGAELTFSTSEDGVIEVVESASVAPRHARATLSITAVAEGTVTLTATAVHAPSGDTMSADVEVVVTETSLPACAGSAEGEVAPGGELIVGSDTLSGAAVRIPEGAAREDAYHVDAFTGRIECGEELAPAGYRALGPPVRFGPAHLRFGRELPLTIPIRLSLLPAGANRGHVEVAYRGPSDASGRIVPIASPRFAGSAGGGTLTFEVPRLGTYQAVVRDDAPSRRTREFQFRGILGFSMGGSGSGRIGLGNPELFDFVAPLGGPTDWTYMLEHIRDNHIGGFCTEAQRNDGVTTGCEAASLARVPAPTHIHEHAQHFEHWWYEDEYDGQGGTFNRTDYISIFRDLAAMFGNPNHDASADPSAPNIAPPGLPESIRTLPETERCLPENQVVIASGFYDDEFNPDGTHPVITFCDGQETGDIGQWDPTGGPRMPFEVAVAVDLNGNGVRDAGEPVIRNGREPFDDFGLDGVPSVDEPGYDPETNPDPAGDDFDFQYNPTGTENNWNRDGERCTAGAEGVAEPFLDVGLDGVMGTAQLDAGGYDSGEGNGCFDRARGAQRMIESSPRYVAEHADQEVLQNLDLFADGGIRDLFNWVVMGNVTMAGWSGRGLPVRFYNDHASLHMEGRPNGAFSFEQVRWDEVGRYAMVRYGDPDVEERFLEIGDGGHVGTVSQLTSRLNAGLAMMSARWPDGDRARIQDRICTPTSVNCEYINQFVFDFTATTGRSGPVTVILPPGYFLEENASQRYPIVYFLHGYGMEPADLIALGLLLWQSMNNGRVGTERRMQKMILVFPDGRCRNGECLRGTFYTDAPESTPDGAQMQTFLLDLIEHMDANYRTRSPESFEVVE